MFGQTSDIQMADAADTMEEDEQAKLERRIEEAEKRAQKRIEDAEKRAEERAEKQIKEMQERHKKEVEELRKTPPGGVKTDNTNQISHALTATETNTVFRALQTDWKNPYFPGSLSALQDLIRRYELHDMRDYYAKTLVFVQSSGMGKSRLADAFGRNCPMINFVLREGETTGFPPSDLDILSFLREPRPIKSFNGQNIPRMPEVAWDHVVATALLQASFETFNTWVEKKPLSTMTLEELALSRHSEMAPQTLTTDTTDPRTKARIEFCDSVITRARDRAYELYFSEECVKYFDDDRPSQVHHRPDEDMSILNDLHSVAKNLMDNFRKCRDVCNDNSLLVIVFDEASSLIKTEHSSKLRPGFYVALNRVISCLKNHQIWSFFLSTESLIRHLVPPSIDSRTSDYSRDTSARLSLMGNTTLKRFAPYVSLQLDVEDRRRIQNPDLRSEELSKSLTIFSRPEHMALFGRPLWHAYINRQNEMLKLAKLKLIGGDQQGTYSPTNIDHVFAALSFRLSLDVCLQNPSTIPLNRRAVNSFMRVVISMDIETGVMNTVTPSEPILARAAMEYLCRGENWPGSITTLSRELLEPGLIDKGHKGELYARLVLTLAHDWIRFPKQPLEFAPTFTVLDLLSALYAQDHHEHIRKIPNETLQARMNFTHFVPAYDGLALKNISYLCHDLLRRSAAMQLWENQEAYDLLLPIYYGSQDENFDSSNNGVIVVQVKNKPAATTMRSIFYEDFINISPDRDYPARSKAEEPDSGAGVGGDEAPSVHQGSESKKRKHEPREPQRFVFNKMKHPVLCLLFDLGVERSDNSRSPPVQVMCSKIKEPEIWGIHSRGHGVEIFGCLETMKSTAASQHFFAVINVGDTLADRLSNRNQTFYRLDVPFRYEGYDPVEDTAEAESQAGVQEVATKRVRHEGYDQVGDTAKGESQAGVQEVAKKKRKSRAKGRRNKGRK